MQREATRGLLRAGGTGDEQEAIAHTRDVADAEARAGGEAVRGRRCLGRIGKVCRRLHLDDERPAIQIRRPQGDKQDAIALGDAFEVQSALLRFFDEAVLEVFMRLDHRHE